LGIASTLAYICTFSPHNSQRTVWKSSGGSAPACPVLSSGITVAICDYNLHRDEKLVIFCDFWVPKKYEIEFCFFAQNDYRKPWTVPEASLVREKDSAWLETDLARTLTGSHVAVAGVTSGSIGRRCNGSTRPHKSVPGKKVSLGSSTASDESGSWPGTSLSSNGSNARACTRSTLSVPSATIESSGQY